MNASLENAVLCVGMLNCDVYFQNLPQNLMQTDTTFARDVTLRMGGDAANVAVNLARMGLCARLGANVSDDVFASFSCGVLEDEGVDTRFVRRDSRTGSAVSLFLYDEAGKKHGASFWGGNMSYSPDDVTDEMLKTARHLHIGSFVNLQSFVGQKAIDLVARAKALDLSVSADISGGRTADMDTMRGVMPLCDVFTMNEDEMLSFTGTDDEKKAAAFIAPFAPSLLILKLGARGVYVSDCKGYEAYFASIADADKIVDTTGAGDAFISGFIAAKMHDMNNEDCVRTGNAAAALCLQSAGASAWGVPFEQVRALAQEKGC